MRIRVNRDFAGGFCAISLATEPPPKGDITTTFFSLQAGPLGGEVVLFLRAEDCTALYKVLDDYLFTETREIQE